MVLLIYKKTLQNNLIVGIQMTRKLQATGPHNERMAALNQRVSGKEIFQIYAGKVEDPLKQLIDKYRRQARNRDQYNDQILQEKIQPLDKLLQYNSRLAPVLTSLEKQNNTLRGEISILSHELRKSLDACQSLIQQNQQQKGIILNKNEDIRKIIQTIAVNETQMRGELEHKNYLLQQENSILIKHLQQIKLQKSTWNSQATDLQEQINRITHKLLTSENHLEEAVARQKQVSKKLFLTQQSLNENLNQMSQLKRQLQDHKLQNNRLKNELELQRVQERTSIKDKFQVQIAGIIQQYQILKQEREGIVKNGEKYRIQNQHLHSKLNTLQRQLERAISNLQLTNSLLNQQKSKNANINTNTSKLQIRINQLKSNNQTMRFELQRSQNISLQKQRMYQKQIDNLRGQIEDRNREIQRKLKDIKQNSQNQMIRKQRQIQELKRGNEQLRSMVERNR